MVVAGDSPIGVFDSGLGGLTVMRSLIDLMPNESLVYIGDTARYPYGNKPAAQVRDYAVELATSLVRDHGAKLIVVACNTAAAIAENAMRIATSGTGELDVPTMKKYIQYCKAKCMPRLSDEAGDILASSYVKIRDDVRKRVMEVSKLCQ